MREVQTTYVITRAAKRHEAIVVVPRIECRYHLPHPTVVVCRDNGIIRTVREQIEAVQIAAEQTVGVQEPPPRRTIISALQIIELCRRFFIKLIN